MKHSDFKIGKEFFTAGGRWLCTDVGNRVIVAISLEPHEVRVIEKRGNQKIERTEITKDPSWFEGPPYAVAETVFGEYDLAGCYPTREDFIKEVGDDKELLQPRLS